MTKTANLGNPEKEERRRIFYNWLHVLLDANFNLTGHRTKGINFFIAMNLFFVFLFATCLTVHATSFSQKVTLKCDNLPVLQVFSAIKEQTGYLVVVNAFILDKMPGVTISARNMLLHDFLTQILQDQPLQFSIKNATIVISPKNKVLKINENQANSALPIELDQALLHKLRIQVLDADGNALSGASITNRNTKNMGLCDSKGYVDLNVEMGDVLEVTFIGFEKQLYTVKNSAPLVSIRMKIATSNLDEIMYTAYGKTSRRLATGDIVKVSGEDIQKVPVLNPLLALEGRVPGLIISKTTGYASSPVKALLRGKLNLNIGVISEPLFVVDGIPLIIPNANADLFSSGYDQSNPLNMPTETMGLSPLFMIQSMDIESVEVLKDADALAMYGAQAANGAILITTKKPKPGVTSFNLKMEKAFTKAVTNTEYLSTPEYLEMRRTAFRNFGETPTAQSAPDLLLWDTSRSVNWQHVLFGGIGTVDNFSLSTSGGHQQVTFNASGSYSRVKEIALAGGAIQRMTFNAGFGLGSRNNRLKADLSARLAFTDENLRYSPKDFTLPPNAPPIRDSLGKYNWHGWLAGQGTSGIKFPFRFASSESSQPRRSNVSTINGRIKYAVDKHLNISLDLQKTFNYSSLNLFTPIRSQNPAGSLLGAPTGSAKFSSSAGESFTASPQIRWVSKKTWGNVDVLVASSYMEGEGKNISLYGTGYTNDNLIESIAGAATVKAENKQSYQKTARIFSIINYNFANKYLLNINVSRDGSTKFGPGKKYGTFASIGMAWILSDEEWMKAWMPSSVSFVKLRGSYGTTGGDGVGDYKYISQWGNGSPILNTYGGVVPIRNLHAVNPDFRWQVSKKRSTSLEMGFFEDRLSMSLTNYEDRMGNQLVQFPLSIVSGFDNVIANFPALTSNTGWELSLNAIAISNSHVRWSVGFNINRNKNVLLKYPNFNKSPYQNTYQIGKPLSIVRVYRFTGLDPFNGSPTYLDLNNDGIITNQFGGLASDMVWIDLTPAFFGGVQSSLNYKRWSMSTSFSYNKATIKDPIYSTVSFSGNNIPKTVWDNMWKKPGDQKKFPRITSVRSTADINFSQSDVQYVEAFYMVLNSIAVSHSINPIWLTKLKLTRASLSIYTNDLFSAALSGNYRPNAVDSGKPLERTLSFALDIGF